MSEERYTTKDLELPDDEPMVIIRSSMLWMCDGDKYAAAALNMYVHWTRWLMKHKPVAQEINRMLKKQGKTVSQDTSLIIYRKQSDLIADLLDFCNEKRFRQSNALLASKGLLKIDNTPRSISDHILKYELQIGKFKALMAEWRKQRQDSGLNEDDEECEVSLEADSDGTDNSPSRNGQFTVSERTKDGSRNGQKSVIETDNSPSRNGQFTAPNKNIDNRVIDNLIDDARESNGVGSIEHNTPPLTLESAIALLAQNGYSISAVPHQSSEQTQPTPVAPSHDAPPFSTNRSTDDTPRSSGESHHTQPPILATQDSGFLPAHESTSASQQRITSNEPPTTTQSLSASSQRENEPLSTNKPNKQASYSREDAHETPEQPTSRQKPRTRKPAEKPVAPTLSPGAQSVYDEWCQLPWFKVAPELTATLAAHCETAKAYGTQNTTLEVMLKVKNWATAKENDKKGYYKGKGWNMKFFLNELPKWLSVRPEQKSEQLSSRSASNDISDIERRQLINFFVDHPDQIEMAAEEYPDLVKIARAELEKLVLARGA